MRACRATVRRATIRLPVRSRRSGRASRPTASSSCRTTPMWMKVIAEHSASSGAGKVAGCGGRWDRHAIYIHAPDRLARRYAHQVLLIEEFHRAGAEVIFLNRSIGGTAEDDLLLQVQGVIAEYERAKILERGRRGRRHAARSGSVSALTGAPFGYRYVRRDLGGGVARFEVLEEEVCIVRLIFAWVGLERTSIREVCRRLERMGCRTRQGATRWYASTICGMLNNPAYIGRAVFGRVTTARLAPGCGRSEDILYLRRVPPNASRRLARNGSRSQFQLWSIRRCSRPFARNSKKTVSANETGRPAPAGCCRGWSYAVAAAMPIAARRLLLAERPSKKLRYYQCSGSEGHRFGGSPPCSNQAVRADRLEEIVWSEVRALLEDPSRVEDEYRRRLAATREGVAMPEEIARLDRQSATLRRGIERLIDSTPKG